MVELLLVQILAPFVLGNFCSKLGILQQVEVMQSMRVTGPILSIFYRPSEQAHSLDEPSVVLLLPVQQILEIVHERRLREDILLGERVQVVWVR